MNAMQEPMVWVDQHLRNVMEHVLQDLTVLEAPLSKHVIYAKLEDTAIHMEQVPVNKYARGENIVHTDLPVVVNVQLVVLDGVMVPSRRVIVSTFSLEPFPMEKILHTDSRALKALTKMNRDS